MLGVPAVGERGRLPMRAIKLRGLFKREISARYESVSAFVRLAVKRAVNHNVSVVKCQGCRQPQRG